MSKNIALHKNVLEDWRDAQIVTNGDYQNYGGNYGHASKTWPCFLTVNLEKTYSIKSIRVLLYDGDIRSYLFRLLTSVDNKIWTVHHDTLTEGVQGWQEFTFEDNIEVQYIRIHGIWNNKKARFHIIEIQAFEEEGTPLEDGKKINNILINNSSKPIEDGDALPVSEKFKEIKQNINKIADYQGTDKELFQEITDQLDSRIDDIETVEKSLVSVRKEILAPVHNELYKSNIIGWGGIISGIIGGLLALLGLLNNIFDFI